MQSLDELIQESTRSHGHICPGQILGVRMAMIGCREIGLDEPKKGKELIVFVEIDRCVADAINAVTGCRLGKRTLKYHDYGKVAATFYNTKTGQAVRIVARDESRELAKQMFAHLETKKEQQMAAYRSLDEASLFKIERVAIEIPPEDMPGRPVSRVICDQCGEGVNDRREVVRDGRILCRACADGAYYKCLD